MWTEATIGGQVLFSHAVPATASRGHPEVHWGRALVQGTKPFNGMQAYGCSGGPQTPECSV
jgi:hypothetical protein